MNVQQAITAALALGLERIDAQMLLLHALDQPQHHRAWLLAHDTDPVSETIRARFMALVRRRASGEPLAYLTGHKEFFGLDLQVDARVLDPRPDTETLVEWALEVLAEVPSAAVIDLGTGSGAIALALKHQRPDLQVTAVDANRDALQLAQANARRLQLPVTFTQGSWLTNVQGRYDVIVSNPPYIAAQDQHLAALSHEPLQALASGADGLDDIRQIVSQAPAHLRPGGWLLLEHGHDQFAAVRDLLLAAGFENVQSRRDLNGIERCSGAHSPS